MPSLPSPAEASVIVLVDPVLPEAWRKLLRSGTTGVLLGLETRMVMARAGREFARRAMDRVRTEVPGAAALVDRIGLPEVRMPDRPGMIIGMEEIVASKEAWVLVPTSVQQNVPAWTIFAMFLIIIPLAGCLIRERQEGTMYRLLMVPGAFLAILLGKAVLYVMVCMIQFGMMFAIGAWVLPALGTPALQAGNHPEAVFVVGLATSLAAVGFGMAVGSVARTPEQASMFGATLVVIAGALGGIMFPVFAMPGFMQKLAHASPLGWSQSAFLDLFLRSGNLATVMPQVLGLLAFAAAGTGVALTFYYRRG
jgi:ABC-2 type transport system permease protein